MNKCLLAVAMLLSTGGAVAATVPTASYNISPGSSFDILHDSGNTTNFYELVVGGWNAYTTFTLADTNPTDGKKVVYDLYLDSTPATNSYTEDNSHHFINNRTLTDLVGSATSPSFSFNLLAGKQYVLVIKNTNGINGTPISTTHISAVPLPAAAWLFGSALLGFVTVSNRRKV